MRWLWGLVGLSLLVAGLSATNSASNTFQETERQELNARFGPLRGAELSLPPANCKPFVMHFKNERFKNDRVTGNDGIWEQVLQSRTPFVWSFPFEEGYAVNHIMEQCLATVGGKRPLVLDGGANMGFFSLAAASCGCQAVAYEPNHKCQQFIGASAMTNGFTHKIARREVAITNVTGPVTFDGWATGGHKGRRLRGVRVDTDVSELLINHYILYFKVDIQGSEDDAIEGARMLLEAKRVKYLAFEAQLKAQATSSQQAFQKMCNFGYECFDVSNPTVAISCTAPLQAYTGALKVCDNLCEKYIMCAANPEALAAMRASIVSQQQAQ